MTANDAKCIYCGNIADTKEHVPAKHFFKGIPDKNLITVPSCLSCNKGFQKDEDFFRQFFVSMLMDRSAKARDMFDNEISRSIKRKPSLGFQMFSQMELRDVYTKSGIYLDKMTTYKISDFDKARINSVTTKIIKGLFFHEFEQMIPEDWVIEIYWITPKLEKEHNLEEVAKTLRWNVVREDTFAYGVGYVPETYQSIWIIDFFKTPLFHVFVLDKLTAKKH